MTKHDLWSIALRLLLVAILRNQVMCMCINLVVISIKSESGLGSARVRSFAQPQWKYKKIGYVR
jgi:hypothetical protein